MKLSNGLLLKQGDIVWCYLDGVQVNPNIFSKPLEWIPERWLSPLSEGELGLATLRKMEESFMPFGYGSRICPGMALAYQEIILAILYLVSYFDMALACPIHEIERISNFVATANKMPLNLKRRNPNSF
jgi:cytochrome P450